MPITTVDALTCLRRATQLCGSLKNTDARIIANIICEVGCAICFELEALENLRDGHVAREASDTLEAVAAACRHDRGDEPAV